MKRLLSLLSLASSESSKSASRTHRRKARRPDSRRPLLELLEDRTVPTAVAPPSGIVSWWTGDNTAVDLVGPNHGALNSGAGYATGNVAGGFNFDGVDDTFQAPTTGLPTGSADRTVELWVKIDNQVAEEAMFTSYGTPGSTAQSYGLGTNHGNLFVSTWGPAIFGPALQTGRWYHVAATNVGTSFKLYLDGVQVSSGTLQVNTPANTSFYMGRQVGSYGDIRRLDGMVDEVTVYNRALTATEIQSIYRAGSDGKIKSQNYIVADGSGVAEGATGSTPQATFTITRVGDLSGQVAVNWTTADGTATAGVDYGAASGQVVFQSGESHKTVSVSVIGDNRFEGDETIRLVLSTADPRYEVREGSATVLNDDALPTVFNFADFSDVSGLNLQGSAASVGGRLRLTPAQGNLSGSAWYTPEKPLVATSFSTTFQFQLTNGSDGSNGGSDGFTFAVQNFNPTFLGNSGGALGYHGLPNSVVIEFDTFQNSENGDSSQSSISVHSNGAGANNMNESYSLGHYDTPALLLENGQTHTARVSYTPGVLSIYLDDLTVPVLVVPVDLAATLNLDGGRAWVGFTAATGGGYENHDILNWSFQGDFDTILASAPAVIEGAAGITTTATFTITRVGSLAGPATVDWHTADGTATAGSDYVAASGQLVFADGEAQKTVTITVNGDNAAEPGETFRLVLSPTADYTTVSGQATILNDDTSVSIGNATALEGVSGLHVLDRFVPDNSGGLSRARTARIGPDGNLYVASADTQSVIRYDGTTGAFLDVVVPSGSGGLIGPNDLAFGTDGSLYVSGSGNAQVLRYDRASGAFLGVVASGLSAPQGITFGPDGALYIVNQGTNEVLRYEGTSLTTFVTAGSGGLSRPRRAVFGPDGSLYVASSATDQVLRYNGRNGAFLNVLATLTSALTSAGWLEIGTDGYLYVSGGNLDGSGNMTIVRLNASTGAVIDAFDLGRDGWSFTLGPDNIVYSSANSAGGFVDRLGPSSLAAIPVSLSFASAVPVTVNYATANGTALAGSDYAAASGTLTFAPGQTTRTILISTLDDTAAEPTETFTVTLSAPVNATIAGGTGVGTIIDNDTTKFYVVDDGGTDRTYRYGAQGNAISNSTLTSGNTAPRGAASNAAGTTLWVADASGTVYVYSAAGGLLGSWTAGGLPAKAQVEGIATNGTDIWLVDNKQGKVFKYTGAASLRGGNQSAAGSFSLASGNGNPKGIVTDGTSLWVVNDNTNDKVFKYTLSGTSLGSWTIDAANASPTGLTINPNNVSDIWVVDSGTRKVYQYTAAAGLTSGSRSASASFALASGNTNPQDIADPPPPDLLLTLAAASAVGPVAVTRVPTVVSRDAVFALLVREPFATPGGVPALPQNRPTTDADFALRTAGAGDGPEPLDFPTALAAGGSRALRPERSAMDPLNGTLVDGDGRASEATDPLFDGPATEPA